MNTKVYLNSEKVTYDRGKRHLVLLRSSLCYFEQQRMNNSKQPVTLGTQGTERRQRKQNTQHKKLKR
jgi:hypothetical protein